MPSRRIGSRQQFGYVTCAVADSPELARLRECHDPVSPADSSSSGRGGNDLQLRFFDAGTNLHRLLDSQVIDHYGRDEAEWVQELRALTTPEKSAEWSWGSPVEWATESLEAAKVLYRQPGSQNLLKPGTKLGKEYLKFAIPIVRVQLARAGVRVAWMLNQVFR